MTKPYIYFGGRLFRPVATSKNSQTNSETIFKYDQREHIVTATYSGGDIQFGQLIGTIRENGWLDFRYHHVTIDEQLRTGMGISEPEQLAGNKLRLYESWQWTSGDKSSGTSTLEEI